MASLRAETIKIGAKAVGRGRDVTFLMVKVAVPSQLFKDILMRIGGSQGDT